MTPQPPPERVIVATYREVVLGVGRTFKLYDEELIVCGGILSQIPAEQVYKLSSLDPEYTFVIRPSGYFYGFAAITALALVLLYRFASQDKAWADDPFVQFLISAVIGGGIATCITGKPMRHARFKGEATLLIADAGAEVARFEKFVSEVQTRIRMIRCNSS